MTHFEFICRSRDIEPTFDMFNVFYKLNRGSSWFSFGTRGGKIKPVMSGAPRSLHEWKTRFFFIKQGVIPAPLRWLVITAKGKVPDFPICNYEGQAWYTRLTEEPTPIDMEKIPNEALLMASMSRMGLRSNEEPHFYVEGFGKCPPPLCALPLHIFIY
jgi:hypothetical protein